MNEFTAKKLGEVLAFCKAGVDTFNRGKDALVQVLGQERVNSTLENLATQAKEIELLAQESNVENVTLPKSEGTYSKLNTMRDTYVAGQWDNPAELLEWLGFFEGSAIVHWNLALGAAEALEHNKLKELCQKGIGLHENLLKEVVSAIKSLAAEKAQK